MIRLFFIISAFATVLTATSSLYAYGWGDDTGNDTITTFFISLVITVVLFFIDRARSVLMDKVFILLFWVISIIFSWISLFGAAFVGGEKKTQIYLLIFYFLLTMLTSYNSKINKILKREMKNHKR